MLCISSDPRPARARDAFAWRNRLETSHSGNIAVFSPAELRDDLISRCRADRRTPHRAGDGTLCLAQRRTRRLLLTLRPDRPQDRTAAPLCVSDRTPAGRRRLNRSFDRCAFPGFQKLLASRKLIPHRFRLTCRPSALTKHPADDVWRSRPHRAETRRRRSSPGRQKKRTELCARATLLRVHKVAQTQVRAVTGGLPIRDFAIVQMNAARWQFRIVCEGLCSTSSGISWSV